VARKDEDFGTLGADSRWPQARPKRGVHAWTDDYSSLLSVWNK
jgi:hypothetical protein